LSLFLCCQMIVMVTPQSRCLKLFFMLDYCGTCIGAACAYVQHVHGCSTCMVAACAWWRHFACCDKCICAACAWEQHLHGGGICMSAALALVQHMHVCGIVMLVPCWPPPRRGSFASLAATCALYKARVQHMHVCGIVMLVPCWPPPRRGSFASLAATCALYKAHVHVATLACSHLQGEAPSLCSVPRLSPAYKPGMG